MVSAAGSLASTSFGTVAAEKVKISLGLSVALHFMAQRYFLPATDV